MKKIKYKLNFRFLLQTKARPPQRFFPQIPNLPSQTLNHTIRAAKLRRRRAPLLLATVAAGVALATASPSGDNGRSVASTLRHGVARSSRAVYTVRSQR